MLGEMGDDDPSIGVVRADRLANLVLVAAVGAGLVVRELGAGRLQLVENLRHRHDEPVTREERRHPDILKASRKKRIAAGAGQSVEQVNKLLKMHRNMADMMKAMGSGKRGPLAGIAQAMGFGGGAPAPSPEQLKALAEKMPGGLPAGGMPSLPKDLPPGGALPNLPKDLPVGLRQGLPNLPGLTGISNKPTLPGLGGPLKKK